MKQVILVAHGKLAVEMLNSAQMIFGDLPNFSAVEFTTMDGLDSLGRKIRSKIQTGNQEILIFTDLFSGTPYNSSCALLMENTDLHIEVLSGMSLPLVLEVAAALPCKKVSDIVEYMKSVVTHTVQSFEIKSVEEEEF